MGVWIIAIIGALLGLMIGSGVVLFALLRAAIG
jgi:hypothetical protein